MKFRVLAVFAGVGAMLAFQPVAAQAEAKPRHCVVDLSDDSKQTCFSTFTEVVAKVTGGRIANAPKDHVKALADPTFLAAYKKQSVAASEFVLSIEYEHTWHEGSTLTAVGNHACDLERTIPEYYQASMPGGWDNRISSLKAGRDVSGNCSVLHFSDPDFRGYTTAGIDMRGWMNTWYELTKSCAPNCYQNFNDVTSSMQWT